MNTYFRVFIMIAKFAKINCMQKIPVLLYIKAETDGTTYQQSLPNMLNHATGKNGMGLISQMRIF